MLTFQPFTRIDLSIIFPYILNIDRVLLLFEVTWKHFFTGVVEFAFSVLYKIVDTDTLCVQLTVVGAFFKTAVWYGFSHMTHKHVAFNRLENAA